MSAWPQLFASMRCLLVFEQRMLSTPNCECWIERETLLSRGQAIQATHAYTTYGHSDVEKYPLQICPYLVFEPPCLLDLGRLIRPDSPWLYSCPKSTGG